MCYYRLWIYDVCGHSVVSEKPVGKCWDRKGKGKGKGKGKERRRAERIEGYPEVQETVRDAGHGHEAEEEVPAEQEASSVASDTARAEDSQTQTQTQQPPSASAQECTPDSANSAPSIPEPSAPQPAAATPPSPKDSHHTHIPDSPEPPTNPPKDTDTDPDTSSCTPLFHPYQSRLLHTLCPQCLNSRAQLLSAVESGNKLHFEDWRWRVKYLSPVPEEARYTGGAGGVDWSEWGEAMGSWVRGKGVGLGIDLEGLLGLGGAGEGDEGRESEVRRRRGRTESGGGKGKGKGAASGVRGGLPSS